jgi:hypothetical protein
MSMETKHGPGHDPQDARSEGYEHSDANPRSLLKSGFTLFVILVLVFLAMRWLFFFYAKVQKLGPAASPFENARVLPPQPRLQVQPRADLHDYCANELDTLNSYGWEDPHNDVVRIPIDRAMDLTLQHGLPARAAGEVPAGISNPATFTAPVEDQTGPCGYVLDRDTNHEMSQEARH